MLVEVESATNYLVHLLKIQRIVLLSDEDYKAFKKITIELLLKKYTGHWYPENPYRGGGYRCLRNYFGKIDPLIREATVACGLPNYLVGKMLPQDLLLWVNPQNVSSQIGNCTGSYQVLYCGGDKPYLPKSVYDLEGTDKPRILGTYQFIKEGNVIYPYTQLAHLSPFTTRTPEQRLKKEASAPNPKLAMKETSNHGSCKQSLRQVDFLDHHNSKGGFEHIPPYVSS
jgi:hypothetical protein